MRVRARLTTATAGLATALAMVASLSGCMTVHGETAVVPAASEEEAQEALERYVEISNEALGDLDPELNSTAETGPLGAIRAASLTMLDEADPAYEFPELEVSDTQFHIPQQAGWPKFFVADTQTTQTPDNRWLIVFTRNSIDEDWRASYLSVMPTEGGPALAEDEDGYLEDLPVGEDTNTGVGVEPGAVGQAYVDYVQSGEGPFVGGDYTSGELTAREEANSDPRYATDYQDQVPEGAEFAPVAMRTQDGGALVFFSTTRFEKQTMAEGQQLVVDPLVEVLLEGEARTSQTLEWLGMHASVVSEGENGQVDILHRSIGVVGATGQ
ncbi:hypothetical protein [Streptomyces litchfieldiae]|uniref:DUF8094 domain-containing protein n=1 Tax=Streptomyces litchfieldiae TaxID=3075543 RepID=A0ABU2MSC8_9ACTN|nr:hypothetical protein [Streptomyces sp. DSM 44938]MDT0344525.1 hypothetical protein [Streptomyces sp. DSM 44938]